MTAITQSFTQLKDSIGKRFRWDYFLQDNITSSVWLTIWVVVLALGTAAYMASKLSEAPLLTIIILIVWAVFMALAIASGLFQKHTKIGDWLGENLVGSVSNALLTLLFMLVLAFAFRSAWKYAVTDATFDPALTAPDVRTNEGGTWGWLAPSSDDPNVPGGARDLLYYGRLDREHVPRVKTAAAIVLVLSLVTFIANRTGVWEKNRLLRQVLTYFWLASPIILFILLNGIAYEEGSSLINFSTLLTGTIILLALYGLLWWQKVIKHSMVGLIVTAVAWPAIYLVWRLIGQSGIAPEVNVDTWGGLMLTMIIATSVILLSFPIGILLAMGRRSDVRGIPNWITWPVVIGVAIWGFSTTPQLLADSRNTFETIVAFWPVLILGVGFALQRVFKGNVVAASSTVFIEFVRGVPLITLLFMAIIMAPFFLKGGTDISKPYAVIAGYTIFASAYMAELIRGGLQAIPKGQFEAADALGLNTLQKMRFVVFPQALRILIPALVGSFIGNFKSSSLVSIVGLLDLVGIAATVVNNPQWLGLRKDLYYGLAIFYFLVSFAMSSYSRRLETKLAVGAH
jgi:general L-amino acid transport system permease protein